MFDCKKIIIRIYPAIMPMVALICAIIIFVSGVGRYRVILAAIIYFIVKSIFKLNRMNYKYLELLYLPLLGISLYYDLQYGQLYPVFALSNPVGAFLLLIVLDIVMNKIIKRRVEALSDYNVFFLCPKCNFEMKELALKCSQCNYAKIDNNIENTFEPSRPRKISNVEQLIDMDPDEISIKNIKLDGFTAKQIFKNNIRLLLSYMVITNKKIVLIDLKTLGRGWSYKEYIYLQDIISLTFTSKFYINKMMPVIEVTTKDNTTFGLYFVYIFSALDKLKDIAKCITNNNKEIKVISDISDM